MWTAEHPELPQITLPGQAATAPGPLDMSTRYLAHHAFRRDLGHLLTTVGRIRLDDRRRITALREHHAWVLHVLHHHRTTEHETTWPRLRERAPEAVATIDTLAAGHAACDRWVLESTDAFHAFDAGPSEQGRDRLLAALRALAETLGAHLARTETDGVPLMMAHVLPREHAAGRRGLLRRYGLRELVELAAWITAELPPDVEDHLRGNSPVPLLLLHALTGARYRRRMAHLWG
ncbi:hemerythrin domain-containing protein [Nonomuraea gerenzanensis]|uniref:Uncharacterized protein n=1 Tax=Nonomuraea gerenzanensis TaxID=93944 RepID=A0A1M4EQQ0_9ACTN|nr:hemerythrin domain-containing protein [Nonomuraea gerenzanensis]UBU12611.1 hemerythrin domain-containing protein [Nonomuraea gerenzanensis]SBP01166.1 hypothetical protein BN4615_P10682 [Nonomuraea gerenzanensis]